MHISPLARAATAVLLAVGMSAVGATAAFADDVTPASDATIASESSEPTDSSGPAETTEPATGDPAEPAEDSPESLPETAPVADPDQVPNAAPATDSAETVEPQPEVVDDPTPYKLLAWQLPCGVADPFCAPGQNLVHVLDLVEPSLGALDSLVVGTCGDWQVDLEWDSATTAALIGIGVLTAPGAPAEDHATGALGAGVNPWKYVDNADCATDGEVVGVKIVPVDPSPIAVTPVASPSPQALVVPLVSSNRYTCPVAGCAQQTLQLPTLALTGSNPIWMLWAALAMLAAGLVVVQVQAHTRRRTG